MGLGERIARALGRRGPEKTKADIGGTADGAVFQNALYVIERLADGSLRILEREKGPDGEILLTPEALRRQGRFGFVLQYGMGFDLKQDESALQAWLDGQGVEFFDERNSRFLYASKGSFRYDVGEDAFYAMEEDTWGRRVRQEDIPICYYIIEPDTLCLFGRGRVSAFEHFTPASSCYPEYPWWPEHEWDFYTRVLCYSDNIDVDFAYRARRDYTVERHPTAHFAELVRAQAEPTDAG